MIFGFIKIFLSLFGIISLFKQTAAKIIEKHIIVPKEKSVFIVGMHDMIKHIIHLVKIEMCIVFYAHFIAAINYHSIKFRHIADSHSLQFY